MKHKNILYRSNYLLAFFLDKGKPCFTYPEVLEALPDIAPSAARQLLSDMAKRGLLMRVVNGLYYIIPFEQDPETFMPDWHLLAAPLTKGYDYYVGYYPALQLHQLITQPSLTEMIVTNHQLKPAIVKVRGVAFQFIYHNKTHFFGTTEVWVDSFNKVMCSDLEKTFVDCLFKPEYGGGIVEIGKGLYQARKALDFEKLLEYCKRFDSQAVIKRLGFLLEVLKIGDAIIEGLQALKTSSYILLDTEMEKEGKSFSRWSIRQNIDVETIENAIVT
jgi:predicted transcriptional regulator of viral defense system